MNYPKMLYRDGALSTATGDQRVVADEDSELAALEHGFSRWDGLTKRENAPAVVPSAALTAQQREAAELATKQANLDAMSRQGAADQAVFAKAAHVDAPSDDDEQQVVKRGPGRPRKAA